MWTIPQQDSEWDCNLFFNNVIKLFYHKLIQYLLLYIAWVWKHKYLPAAICEKVRPSLNHKYWWSIVPITYGIPRYRLNSTLTSVKPKQYKFKEGLIGNKFWHLMENSFQTETYKNYYRFHLKIINFHIQQNIKL